MTAITAAMIKELRDRTGVGMGKCKEALEESQGDMELAISNLRKAGIASAVKKEGREIKEGMIGYAESDRAVALVEIGAETDFVVKNDRFQQFLSHVAQEAARTLPASLESFLQQSDSKESGLTIDQHRATVMQAIGENIQIRRLLIVEKDPDSSIGTYCHLGGKMVTLVEIAGNGTEEVALAREIAMHVAAAAPDYLSPKDVPPSVIAHERDIARSQIQGKPEFIIEKIVEGKVNAYYDATCLLRQKYIKDDALTIAEFVAQRSKAIGKQLTVKRFVRMLVGQ